jgi:sorting nexin-8
MDKLNITVPCTVRPSMDLDNIALIDARVYNAEEVKKGMFSSKYVAYKIKTEPYGWDVQRRFNDFNWLRCILAREFPAYYIPPILPKTTKRKFEKYFIYKRMAFFNKFLKAICQHSELKNSKYFVAFLKT